MTDEKQTEVKQEGRNRGRQRQNRNNNRDNIKTRRYPPPKKFTGETEDFHDIYDFGTTDQAETFTTTTKKLAVYAGRTCHEPQTMRVAIESLKPQSLEKPKPETEGDADVNKLLLIEATKGFYKKRESQRRDSELMYSVIIGQCSDAMTTKIEAMETFQAISEKSDAIGLLKLIRSAAFAYEDKKYPFIALHSSLKRYYSHFQLRNVKNDSYLDTFISNDEVVSHMGGEIGVHPTLMKYILVKK